VGRSLRRILFNKNFLEKPGSLAGFFIGYQGIEA
jgi:hypothetical protein